MNKCLKETFQVIRLEGGNIVLFELIYRMISLPIYLQLLDRAVHFSLDRAGYSYITNENIVDYLAKPWTFICLAGLMAAAFILLMIEAAGLSGAFQAAAYHRKLSALLIFEAGLVQLKEEVEKRNWKLFLMVFIQYLLFNMFFLYRLFSHMRPVSFIMKELFGSVPGRYGMLLFIAGCVVLCWGGIFTVQGCMIEQKSFDASYEKSRQLVKGRLKLTALPAAVYIGIIGTVSLLYVLVMTGAAFLVMALQTEGVTGALFIEARNKVEPLFLIAGSICMSIGIYGVTTVMYYQLNSSLDQRKHWDFSFGLQESFKKRKLVLALFMAGGISVFLTYDAVRNGIGIGADVLEEISVTAHRGSSERAPENTMAAVEAAVEDMADFVEIDVQMTADGYIVLSHDKNLKRTAGEALRIQNLTWEQVKQLDVGRWFSPEYEGEKIPDLPQVMDYAKGKINLNIEIKNEGAKSSLPEKVAELIQEFDMYEQCIVTSTSLTYLERIKEADPNIITGYIISAAFGNYYSNEALDLISIRSSFVNHKLVSQVHEAGKGIHVWTVNTRNEIDRMKLLGVDNVITDKPQLAKEIIYAGDSLDSVTDCLKVLLR